MTSAALQAQAALILRRRGVPLAAAERTSDIRFRDYIEQVNRGAPGQLPLMAYEHVPRLVDVAQKVTDTFITDASGEYVWKWGGPGTPNYKRVLILLAPRYFKALANGTEIPTPDGFKAIEDLRPGDNVFGPDGKTTRVQAVKSWKNRPCFRVTTDDGHSVIADEAHEWTVRMDRRHSDRFTTHETRTLWERQEAMRSHRRPALPRHEPIGTPDADLPIPPYTLGAWLGDGASHYGGITIGDRDREWMRKQVEADGFRTRMHSCGKQFGVLGLVKRLRETGLLRNKHIPAMYFRASIDQRKALLQGLIDTDGTVSANAHGQVTFVSTRKNLAQQVAELVHTLGVKASVREYRASIDGRDCGPKWYTMFHYEQAARMTRKAEKCENGTRTPWRFLSFAPVENHDTTCISVDRKDGLFLAGRACIVTHNSEIFSRLLSGYFLRQHPHLSVGLGSYGADLAWKLSGSARDYFRESGGHELMTSDARKLWSTSRGGEMWAAGIDGRITGFGYNLGILDDPMKPKHARSLTYVEQFREFWAETWYNRQEPPGAAMIVVMQRLGQSDPIDYLYRREVGDEAPEAAEHWHVVCCDEVKSSEPLARYDGPMGLPPTCTLELDPRDEGELLAPSRFDAEEVSKQQVAAGVYRDSQRQQRPGRPAGDFWRSQWFAVYGTPNGDPLEELPRGAFNLGRDWDTAYTDDEANSPTAMIQTCRMPGDEWYGIYVTDIDWRWYEAPERIAWMKRMTGPHFIEAKATGKSDAQQLRRARIQVKEVRVQGGDKYARSAEVQPDISTDDEYGVQVRLPRVFVHASIYDKLMNDEQQGLLSIKVLNLIENSGYLDVNDVFTQALNRHLRARRKPDWAKQKPFTRGGM